MNGELDALAQACCSFGTPAQIMSDFANRINGILREITANQTAHGQITRDEKQFIVRGVVMVMEKSFEDLDTRDLSSATDLSRLAWLQLHVDDHAAALATVKRGLAIDPNSSYCRNLANRLEDSF